MVESRPLGINRRVRGSSPLSGANFQSFGSTFLKIHRANSASARPTTCPVSLHSHNRTDKLDGKYTLKNGPRTMVCSQGTYSETQASAERAKRCLRSA